MISTLISACAHPEISILCSLLFAFGLLGIVLRQEPKWRIVSLLIMFGSHFAWLLCPDYHGYAIIIVWGVLTLLYAGVLEILVRIFDDKPWGLAASWTLFEVGMSYFLCGFTIDQMGVHLLAIPQLAQLASVGGSFLLSFIVMAWNAHVAYHMFTYRLAWFIPLSCILYYMPIKTDTTHNVALVQTGLRPEQKRPIPGRFSSFIPLDTQIISLRRILDQIKPGEVDLIVFPEAALPFGLDSPLSYDGRVTVRSFFQSIADEKQARVISGLIRENNGEDFTSALEFTPGSTSFAAYDKRVLMPIAEEIPLAVLKPIARQYGIGSSFARGVRQTRFSHEVEYLPSICYEEMLGRLQRSCGKLPRLMVNVTNDVWYPNSTLPKRHLTQGKLRAIENRVPLVRSCNTGVTAAIDPKGREIARLHISEWESGILFASVPVGVSWSFYGYFGDAPLVITLIFVIMLDLFLPIAVSLLRKTPKMIGVRSVS